jgi:hypothetical protein
MVGNVTRMMEIRNADTILAGNVNRRDQLGYKDYLRG